MKVPSCSKGAFQATFACLGVRQPHYANRGPVELASITVYLLKGSRHSFFFSYCSHSNGCPKLLDITFEKSNSNMCE